LRRYLNNKKAKQSNAPKGSVVGCQLIYTSEEVKQCKMERVQRYYRKNKGQCLKQSRRWHLHHKAKASKQKIAAC